jgi:hypothetical protein
VRPGNSWDLRSCRQQPRESLRDYIHRFSKQRTELPTRASELMDIATKFASGQEAVEAIFRKDKQPQGRQPEDVPEASAQRGTKKKGKKKSQAKRDTADADLVAAAEYKNPRKPPGGANLFDKMLKEPCPYHQGRPKRPHRCLGTLTKPVPRMLLSLIVKNEEGIRSPTGPEPERLTPPVGTAPRGDEAAAPQDGSRFCAPSSEASSSDASVISASATGGSTARTATTMAEAGASAGDASGGLEAAAAPAVSLGTTTASTEELASGARPTATCAAWAPRFGASCKEVG